MMLKILNKNLFLLCMLIIYSCNHVKYSFTGASIPPEVQTFSVNYFPATASLAPPTLSQSFTEAVKDVFLSQTRLNLVSDQGDLQFEGNITGYDVSPVGVTGNEIAAKNRLKITVFVKFTNTKDESASYESSFSRFFDFDNTQELTTVEDELIEEINAQLVQDIFNKAVGDW